MDRNYVVIQSWMTTGLKLSGNELLVYALIYGFSQDGESSFYGSRRYISEMFNITLPTVDKSLKSLIEKELIKKEENSVNGIKFNTYKILLQPIKNLYMGCKESLPNNITNNHNYHTSKLVDNYEVSNSILSKDNIGITTNSEFPFGKSQPKKEGLYSKCINLIDEKTDDVEIRNLLIEWLNMLLDKFKDRERPLYLNMFKGKLKMLDKYDTSEWKDLIETSLQRGWEGFYKSDKNIEQIQKPSYNQIVRSEKYTEEELLELRQKDEERARNGLPSKF